MTARRPNSPRISFGVTAILALLTAAPLRAEIELIGVLVTSERSLFALTDTGDKTATWRALGETFSGATLKEFDRKSDTLTLAKDGALLRVRLKDDAKVKNGRLELSGTVTAGSDEKLEVTRVTLTLDQETVLPLKDGITWRIKPELMADGNICYRFSIEREVGTGTAKNVEQLSAPNVIVRPTDGFMVGVGDLKFAFSPTRR